MADQIPCAQPARVNVVASTAEERDAAIRMWHKHCDPFKSWMGDTPPSPVIDAMLAFAQASAIPAPEGAQAAVMRQALAALDAVMVGSTLHDDGDGWGTIAMPKPEAMTLALAAATALRAALAAPAPQAPADGGLEALRKLLQDAVDQLNAAKAPAWQPIETAPKDGSLFLCWVASVRFKEEPETGDFLEVNVSAPDFGRWAGSEDDGYYEPMSGLPGDHGAPTHWMPLPAAPQNKEPTNDR